jgi:hypothetical protein
VLPRHRSEWPQWLEQLLGPAEPELGCDECFVQLDRYLELELSGVDAAAELPRLHAHLTGCAACNEEHDDLLAFLRSQQPSVAPQT